MREPLSTPATAPAATMTPALSTASVAPRWHAGGQSQADASRVVRATPSRVGGHLHGRWPRTTDRALPDGRVRPQARTARPPPGFQLACCHPRKSTPRRRPVSSNETPCGAWAPVPNITRGLARSLFMVPSSLRPKLARTARSFASRQAATLPALPRCVDCQPPQPSAMAGRRRRAESIPPAAAMPPAGTGRRCGPGGSTVRSRG